MKPEDRKLIFDYCGWSYDEQSLHRILTGNDIVKTCAVMESKMVEDDFTELDEFYNFIDGKGDSPYRESRMFSYLFQNFFTLMAEWLKERKS